MLGFNNMKQYRQGDVFIEEVEAVPIKAKIDGTNILVYGEVTGHAHRLKEGELWALGEDKFVVAKEKTKVEHEEHDTIELPEGIYKVIRQREYDENEIRYVRD